MALQRVWMPSPCYSSRGGTAVRLLVVHTTEGSRTIESLGGWFGNAANQVSSHTGADDKPNTVGEYVKPADKAWTCQDYNGASENIELCAFASWSRDEWLRHDAMLRNTAAWIQEEANRYGIPLVRLSAGAAQGSGRGIAGHGDLGVGGGNHTDPGSGFPWDVLMGYVTDTAPAPKPPEPEPAPTTEEPAMATSLAWNGGQHVFAIGEDGKLVQRWETKDAHGKVGWKNHVILSGATPNQSPTTDQHSGQLHLYATRPDSKLAHAWQAKGGDAWGTETLT